MNYLELLNNSYRIEKEHRDGDLFKLEFLANSIFGFNTYDLEMDSLFAEKALEVCVAITEKNTYEYIDNKSDYQWYLIMCHMPFFVDKLGWGTSIRGAWWNTNVGYTFSMESCGLWDKNEKQMGRISFTASEWEDFIKAMVRFNKEVTNDNPSV